MIKRLLRLLGHYGIELVLVALVLGSSWLIWRAVEQRERLSLEAIPLGRPLVQPTQYIPVPSHNRFIVLEKAGRATWFDRTDTSQSGAIFDFSQVVYSAGHEEGLLGLALAPSFPSDPHAYVFYNVDAPLRSRLVRVKLGDNLAMIPGSEEQLLEIEKVARNHNGGMLLFDRDGYLLVSLGDSSVTSRMKRAEVEPLLQGQTSWHGKILRLRVDPTLEQPYEIPTDNPFVGQVDARPEIWAYGFRNAWRMSYDPPTGDVYAFDVGGGKFEEVNKLAAGANFGWPIMEGAGCAHSSDHGRCDMSGKVKPLGAYAHHTQLNAITGGLLYRGDQLPQLREQIIFASFQSGMFAFRPNSAATNFRPTRLVNATINTVGFVDHPLTVSSLDRDADGEPVIVDYGGHLFRLRPTTTWAQTRSFINTMWAF